MWCLIAWLCLAQLLLWVGFVTSLLILGLHHTDLIWERLLRSNFAVGIVRKHDLDFDSKNTCWYRKWGSQGNIYIQHKYHKWRNFCWGLIFVGKHPHENFRTWRISSSNYGRLILPTNIYSLKNFTHEILWPRKFVHLRYRTSSNKDFPVLAPPQHMQKMYRWKRWQAKTSLNSKQSFKVSPIQKLHF